MILFYSILLRKLDSLGIRGNLHTWIKSYLTNRSQFVMYNNSKSETNLKLDNFNHFLNTR